ncbi:MAG: hypothetical protein ACKVP0_21555 [Pirellulaceae bacterium]
MEPFSITCTTCKSRLKVKSEAAIGHLLKCPKCGGMVMVKLPEEPKPGDSASLRAETAPSIQKPIRPADAQDTLGEDQDFEDVEALLAAGAPKGMPPSAKSSTPAKTPATSTAAPAKTPAAGPAKTAVRDRPSRFAEGEPAVGVVHGTSNGSGASGINGKTAAANGTAVKEPVQKEPAPPVPGSEALPLPSSHWSSQRPWKSWLFLAVSILLGMGLAFGVVAFTLNFFGETPEVAVNPDQNPGGENKPVETVPAAGIPGTESGTTNPAEPAKGPTETTKLPAVEKEPAKPAEEKGKTEKTRPASPPSEDDPLGLNKKPPEEPKPASTLPANDPFSRFENILGSSRDPTAPAVAPEADGPALPKPAEPPAEGPVKPTLPRPAARLISIPTRMNDPIPGLKISADEVSLADFLQTMQDFSTIPITLEPDNLCVFKQTAVTPVPAFEGENLKFGALLTSVLTPLGLEAVVEDDQLIVRKPELTRDKMTKELKLRQREYDVRKLTHEDEKQATELAERVMALIEPGTWGDDDDETACALTPGKTTFVVRHRLSAHVQFLMLLEKLRVARGLTPLSEGYDADTFRLATRTEKAAARLAAPIKLTFNLPTPLVKVCQALSKEGKMRILIDWRSIAPSGWNPDAEVKLKVDGKPLSEALTALLEPMDLAYRVVDGKTIQIVSPQFLAEHLELEVHSVKELVASEEQIEPLLARVRGSLTDGAAEPPGQLWLDPESKSLVAMLPQPKQQLLTKLLAEWKTKETN